MSMPTGFNWGELMENAGGFEPLPKGPYDVVVVEATAKMSSTNKQMFAIKYQVEGGPHNGRTLFNNITLTTDNPVALRMFFLNMKAMGLTKEFFDSGPVPDAVATALVGQRCRVEVDHREWNGELREQVKSVKPPLNAGTPSAGPQVPGAGTPTPSAGPAVPSPEAPVQQESTVPIPAPTQPAPPQMPI